MKKWICFVLCLVMVLGMVGCSSAAAGGKNTEPASQETADYRVGYSRVNITPDEPTPLQGYGNADKRLHTEVLDYLYLTCVALTDAADQTFLFFCLDIINGDAEIYAPVREQLSQLYGIPEENMSFNCTHTHSAPKASQIPDTIEWAALKAAKEAMADRKAATLSVGSTNTVGLNFVRHYFKDNGGVKADNHESGPDGTIVSHTTEVDTQMQVMYFERQDAKDVLLVNWQTHPHITGGSTKTSMSADIIGMFRNEIETQVDCLFAYFQGAGGNINPISRIAGEEVNTTSPRDYRVNGQYLAMHAVQALQNLTPVEPGLIKVITETVEVDSNKSESEKRQAAADVSDYYKTHTAAETSTYCRQNYPDYIYSAYHANAIVNRSGYDDKIAVMTAAVSLGNVAFAFAPYEMFDTNGMYIKENSPFRMTFVMGYSNDSAGYIPSAFAFEYGTYEADTTRVAPGCGELLADHFLEMLNELKK